MNEQRPRFEQEPDLEQAIAKLGEFVRELGFVSTPEMDALVTGINSENESTVIPQWHALASEQVEKLTPGEDHRRGQAGLMVEEIRINLKAGSTVYARRSINDAMDYLDMDHLDEYGMRDIADYLNDLGHMLRTMEK
jgi:hypothetical protein